MLKTKSWVLFLSFFLLLCPLRQAYGMSSICRAVPKICAGFLAGVIAVKATQIIYLWHVFSCSEAEGLVEYNKGREKYLASEHIQKMVQKIYDELCARKRKWYHFKGRLNDFLVKRYGLLNVYQGDPEAKVIFEDKLNMAYSSVTGIHFRKNSFTADACADATQRANLHHELIHLFRGDYLSGSMWFLKHIEKHIKRLKIHEFETEKETIVFLHKARDYEALLWRLETRIADFQREPYQWCPYEFGALDGYAKIKKDPEFAKKLKTYLDERWNHTKDCKCSGCSILKLCKNWKPKGFLRSKLWHRKFLKKCMVGQQFCC